LYERLCDTERVSTDCSGRNRVAALIGLTKLRLREELTEAGKAPLFDALEGLILGAADAPQREIAERLGVSVEVVRTSIHRLRGRYRELLREEVRRTVLEKYGEKKLYEGGLSVRTTLDPKLRKPSVGHDP
jgi:hypothetical protein